MTSSASCASAATNRAPRPSLSLSVEEYEAVRAERTHFALLRDHEILDVESPIHETDRFLVVQKFREEAAAAIETDPRS
jgi:hypothetical protein